MQHFINMWWAYVVIFVMICLSAFFSASEMSFNTANKMRLRHSAEEGSKTAKTALNIAENFTTSLSSILIGNNLANIAVSTCTTLIIMDLFPGHEGVASTVATIAVTIVILICGEIVPKNVAKQHAEGVARVVAIPIRVLTLLLSPLVALVMILLFLLRKLWGKDYADGEPTVSEEELTSIIEMVEEEGVIDEEQSELLQSALEFDSITVEKIMTPRVNVTALDVDADENELHAMISDHTQFSRLPVYEESIDNIIGILSLTRYYKANIDDRIPDIRSILLEPCKIHKTMKLPAALARLREQKMHLAIVIDEFGGTLGVVTMEDILEQLVGDIWDDTDVIVNRCIPTGENTYEVAGEMNIEDCFDEIEFDAPEDFSCEYTTMGGWAIQMLEANPHVGDSFHYENLFVVVSEMEDQIVTKLTVLVTRAEKDEDELED